MTDPASLPAAVEANITDDDYLIGVENSASVGTKMRRFLFSALAGWIATKLFGAWTAYTPVISAQTGTITAYTATGFYKKVGRVIHVKGTVTITTNGTGASALFVSLPFAIAAGTNAIGIAREYAAAGTAIILQGAAGGSSLTAVKVTDSSYPVASGQTFAFAITYETTT